MKSSYDNIYQIVRRIPCGKVATYGQIARLLHRPRWARVVGYALSALNDDTDIPWHRVVNAKGEISERKWNDCDGYQRVLLEDEGIAFDKNARINLSLYAWRDALVFDE